MAKGEHGKHSQQWDIAVTGTETLVATPNPARLGELVTITGTGFLPDFAAGYTMQGPIALNVGATVTDSEGNVEMSFYAFAVGETFIDFAPFASVTLVVIE